MRHKTLRARLQGLFQTKGDWQAAGMLAFFIAFHVLIAVLALTGKH